MKGWDCVCSRHIEVVDNGGLSYFVGKKKAIEKSVLKHKLSKKLEKTNIYCRCGELIATRYRPKKETTVVEKNNSQQNCRKKRRSK